METKVAFDSFEKDFLIFNLYIQVLQLVKINQIITASVAFCFLNEPFGELLGELKTCVQVVQFKNKKSALSNSLKYLSNDMYVAL